MQMVPMIRNILGGFLFSGDDVYKHVRVLSGGERTRLAVARMLLLRPSNTLLLDEPTNHLDLDSKEVLLDALVDYGGTLIFVSHDRYFVERLATKIIEIGNGTARRVPGDLQGVPVSQGSTQGRTGRTAGWAGGQAAKGGTAGAAVGRPAGGRDRGGQGSRRPASTPSCAAASPAHRRKPRPNTDSRREEARRRRRRARSRRPQARGRRAIATLEARIAETEAAIREVEQQMSAPGFYEDRAGAQPVIDRHQALMWQVGDLMHQWEELQSLGDLDRSLNA